MVIARELIWQEVVLGLGDASLPPSYDLQYIPISKSLCNLAGDLGTQLHFIITCMQAIFSHRHCNMEITLHQGKLCPAV